MIIKDFICNDMVCKDSFSNNIEQYMEKALEMGNTIYFYAIDPIESIKDIDTLSWIRDIKHEEYDMISVHWPNGRKMYYQSKVLSDKVIKLDLTDSEVKKVFDDKFKIGITWARRNTLSTIGEGNPLFEDNIGYELHNFVVTKNDGIIMDVSLHGGFDIAISKEIVAEVDKTYTKGDTSC